MKDYEKNIRKTPDVNPALGRMPGFEGKTLTDAFQQGQEAGVKAEEAPVLQQIETQVLRDRDFRAASLIRRELSHDTAILGENVSFRRGYILGLQKFLKEHNVDIKSMLYPNATPEGLKNDDALIGYLRGMRRQSPNKSRAWPQEFKNLRDYESEIGRPAGLRLNAAQEQGGYKLGFLVGVARDVNVTLTGLEIPSDNPSYEVFMQGSRGETRAMPIELNPKTDKYERYELGGGIWVYDALDDSAYRVGQRVWLASEGVDASYAYFIRHPEALRAFKAGLEGQVLPEYDISSILDTPIIERRGRYNYDSMLTKKQAIDNNSYPKEFNEFRRPDPLTEARKAGKTGYEMGQLARRGRQRAK